jgi:hypothetical protein
MRTTDGALAAAARRYAELGYPVFPCAPDQKVPLTEHGFRDASVDPDQVDRWWAQHPAANVGIATEGLVVVDVDGADNPWPADDPDRALDLAGAPLAQTPRAGRHVWFRQPAGRRWRCTEGRLADKVDTRADGGYVVVPPSVVEGRPYRWAPGLALDDSPEHLSEPPGWLVAALDALLNPPSGPEAACPSTESNGIPQGHRNAALARLAGTMRRVGMTRSEIAAALQCVNRDRCRPPLPEPEVERVAASVARYDPDAVAVALAEDHWEQMYHEVGPPESFSNADPGPTPDSLLHVPGFVDDVMAHTLRTAPYPERTLAFCGALALQAVLAGRKVRDESDCRTNLYLLALANSGAGKDHPRKVNQRVLIEAGLADGLGTRSPAARGSRTACSCARRRCSRPTRWTA